MRVTSILAIYFLCFVMSFFFVMPFGMKTHEEAGIEKVPGQAESAPAEFSFGRVAVRAAVLGAVFTALFVLNYVNGWVTVADLEFLPEPPRYDGSPAKPG